MGGEGGAAKRHQDDLIPGRHNGALHPVRFLARLRHCAGPPAQEAPEVEKEKKKWAGLQSGREGGREGKDGRQRQIAAFNSRPWGAAEGDRERERHILRTREAK